MIFHLLQLLKVGHEAVMSISDGLKILQIQRRNYSSTMFDGVLLQTLSLLLSYR